MENEYIGYYNGLELTYSMLIKEVAVMKELEESDEQYQVWLAEIFYKYHQAHYDMSDFPWQPK